MAKLTTEQDQAVRQWVADGANLNEIQDRLKREHDVTLTYLDSRLLLAELGLKLLEKPKEAPPKEKEAVAPEPQLPGDETVEAETLPPVPPPTGGKATVVLDTIAIPGMLASGKVTFSDGKIASWYLDEMGRLGMNAPSPGYKPPPADIPVFQRELDLTLKRAGF
ncbi:MAG: hypothetical protein K8R87_12155 [Verrucomicrobia bacterium]|nr:hypothetical protein [Verrucomicrobiota bacterium]